MTTPTLTIEALRSAVTGSAAAIRARVQLQPAGGQGDKVFPPTYQADRAPTRYAFEQRRVDGVEVCTVLLDSVASQANRMEDALLAAWDEDPKLLFPVIAIDFAGTSIADLDRITTLQAPHRIADALFRDSMTTDGTPFRDTPIGRAYTDATVKNASAVYFACPTALVFGVWDSTGPRGGLGAKFQRALVSEIVGVGAVAGVKTASRLDPAAIQANVEVYHARADHDEWTTDPAEAELDKKGNPVLFSRKGSEGKGKPSSINHSNIPPSIDSVAGGVTFDHALQTTVLSLPALRKLRFQVNGDGKRLENDRSAAEDAARVALAALAMAAVAENQVRGYDLRSRSFLVPSQPGQFELEFVPGDGSKPARYLVDATTARAILKSAEVAAAKLKMGWKRTPLELVPAPKLAGLIDKSRKAAAEAPEAD